MLANDLGGNCLGRAYLLAELLRPEYQVRIIGPINHYGPEIWSPCPRGEIPIEVWCPHRPSLDELIRQSARLDADVLVASKPLQNSFGLALLAAHRRRLPVVLDIDDWEPAGEGYPSWWKVMRSILRPWKWYRFSGPVLDRLTGRADAVTVSTTFLQKRYGGEILPHVRDTDRLDPSKVNGLAVRRRLGLEGVKIVLFLGTPRPHKGVEDAIAAVAGLRREDVRFLLVGAREDDAYVADLRRRAPSVIFQPPCKWSEAPSFLAAADVVVVPQRDTIFARGQLPAKLIDAMAMGRPTVATAVSDIPRLLRGCGKIVPPGDVAGLASAIREVLDNPREAALMGSRAREKAVRELSYETGRAILHRAVNSAMERSRIRR